MATLISYMHALIASFKQSMVIQIKKLYPDVKLPGYAHPGDAGLDVYARETQVINPGERKFFMLGFAMEFDHTYVAIVKDRGSMAKNGLHTMGGVFDAGYRGEYNILLVNLGDQPYTVNAGDKIAQIVILPFIRGNIQEVAELSDSQRGSGQFGSTGK